MPSLEDSLKEISDLEKELSAQKMGTRSRDVWGLYSPEELKDVGPESQYAPTVVGVEIENCLVSDTTRINAARDKLRAIYQNHPVSEVRNCAGIALGVPERKTWWHRNRKMVSLGAIGVIGVTIGTLLSYYLDNQ